jgi:hypothetical protein
MENKGQQCSTLASGIEAKEREPKRGRKSVLIRGKYPRGKDF